MVKDSVSESDIISRDVTEAPNGLLFDLNMGVGVGDANQDWDSTIFDQLEDKLAVARRNVREAPDGLELQLGRVQGLTQLQQAGDHVSVHGLLNWRVLLE